MHAHTHTHTHTTSKIWDFETCPRSCQTSRSASQLASENPPRLHRKGGEDLQFIVISAVSAALLTFISHTWRHKSSLKYHHDKPANQLVYASSIHGFLTSDFRNSTNVNIWVDDPHCRVYGLKKVVNIIRVVFLNHIIQIQKIHTINTDFFFFISLTEGTVDIWCVCS